MANSSVTCLPMLSTMCERVVSALGQEPKASSWKAGGGAEDAPVEAGLSEAEDCGEGEGEEDGVLGTLEADVWSAEEALHQCEVAKMGYISCNVPLVSRK